MTPYYADDQVTLYLGDCRQVTEWLSADVLVTDPPYGRKWNQGWKRSERTPGVPRAHLKIGGDSDASVRDAALGLWGAERVAVVFGDLMLTPPGGNKQTLVYRKPSNAGSKGTRARFRRDIELIYLTGPWPVGFGGRTSVIETGARSQGNPSSAQGRYAHPHAKPVDVMETLIAACPPGTIADPFAGSGSTLVAARNLGRKAIGVEIEERYAEAAAKRLRQDVLVRGDISPGVSTCDHWTGQDDTLSTPDNPRAAGAASLRGALPPAQSSGYVKPGLEATQ